MLLHLLIMKERTFSSTSLVEVKTKDTMGEGRVCTCIDRDIGALLCHLSYPFETASLKVRLAASKPQYFFPSLLSPQHYGSKPGHSHAYLLSVRNLNPDLMLEQCGGSEGEWPPETHVFTGDGLGDFKSP